MDSCEARGATLRPARDRIVNGPLIPRSILRMHAATVESKFPLRILGLLPRGSAAHVPDADALDFLAEKRPGLGLLDLCEAEVAFGDLLGRPVGIVLASGLTGREAQEFPNRADPL